MRFKKTLSFILIVLSLIILTPSVSAIELLPPGCKSPEGCSLCDFITLFINAADILVGLSGTFAVLMFVMGGVVIITAYGNESKVKWGKDILIATVVGIFIVLFAWTLINLIIGALYGNPNQQWANIGGGGVQCP